MKPLNILFVTSEAAPYAKSGGLGSVMHSLPRALRRLGHDARVMMPRYLSIRPKDYRLTMVQEHLAVPSGDGPESRQIICNVKGHNLQARGVGRVPTYFLENHEYYEQREHIYGYGDDPVRWGLLCRGTLEFLLTDQRWRPDVIVGTDWMTGYLPQLLKERAQSEPALSAIATVFSIHNLSYQGVFKHRYQSESERDDGCSLMPDLYDPRMLTINGMRRGILYADAINTVSETYAKEITTPENGELLDQLLKEKRSRLRGILNGIDYEIWNPKQDRLLPHLFSVSHLAERAKNRRALQERFGLDHDDEALVVGVVSRLSRQKGFDLLVPIAAALFEDLKIQLVVIGEGDTDIMKFFQDLETTYPGRVGSLLQNDKEIPPLVFAGSDAVLIPSRFEPCGLIQMEAMRYGSVPIVHFTGGLADTVHDYNPMTKQGTGFVFQRYDASSLLVAVTRATVNHRHQKQWETLVRAVMKQNFSWDASAKKYEALFQEAMTLHQTKK